ncbi:amino acid permease [Pseudomonas sp. GD03860]|uniref:amino acid permease n=1 Tax=Pseudomonas TaxID=286 RepID=UPI002363ABE9|nr:MULTISPECIES: amino acid permease [Pseudomonas]MDD2056500.1 amino acid permease [Pseudomonas putida]MDH0640470.1 amino acid permease [Pseudomonas sp. GD03860]
MSAHTEGKLNVVALTALVVGSMIGAGIFSLPATFAGATGGLGALIAWLIAGIGMLMLAFVFQNLAHRKPELDSGIYAYARAGFGNYLGFASAFGFWAGTCIGNVSYFILIKSTLGSFFPVFGDGNTLAAIAASSVLLWGFHFLVLRGVQQATVINTIATIAKIIPIVVFVVVLIVAFDRNLFMLNFWGDALTATSPDLAHADDYGRVGHAAVEAAQAGNADGSLFEQVRATMLVTVFVFLGIEGASVYSRYATNRRDVGIATILGFLGVLGLLMLITLLSYGVMLRPELAELRQPSMAGVLEAIVGHWGAIFISIGLLVSVLGAYLSWTLLAAEVLFSAAHDKAMPQFLSRENAHKVPSAALWLTTLLVQFFLVLTFFTEYAFTLALELTSSLTLIPYLLVAAYALKLAKTRETYTVVEGGRAKDLVIAILATAYALLMLYAGGLKYLLLSAVIYAPGTLLYIQARREQGLPVFSGPERLLFAATVVGAIVAVHGLATGWITL